MAFRPILPVPDVFKQRIQARYQLLKRAQDITGVPWQAIAAVWARESSCRDSVSEKGGPMQFDPIPNDATLRSLLDKWTNLQDFQKRTYFEAGVNNLEAAFVFAACFMCNKVNKKITITSPDELIKDAFWAYNGRAYGSADRSPYVMNGFSPEHKDMKIKGTINGRPVDSVDQNPGAFVIYKQLCIWFPHPTVAPTEVKPEIVPVVRKPLHSTDERLNKLYHLLKNCIQILEEPS